MATIESTGFIESLAGVFGSSAPALRLLISVLLGYPLAILYRNVLTNRSPTEQHLYFTISGIWLCYFNYGFDVLHIVGCIIVLYILLKVQGGTKLSVFLGFNFFMGYLLLGYYYTETEGYDIKWTMPHCVFALKAIGLVFDIYDGKKKDSGQFQNALSQTPSLLEIAGYSFFYGTCLVGPQMSAKRYLTFVNKEMKYSSDKPNSFKAGVIRGCAGLIYLSLYLVGNSHFPYDYVFSDSFKNNMLLKRIILMAIWGKIMYSKYIISWILSEGSCILTGITYNGKDENGEERWDGCANVNLVRFETATKFGHIIQSFNITTNTWAATYVYKRLKFLGNKLISQGVTLAFLAVWHGLHFTYYLTFFLEFTVMKLEHDVEYIISKNEKLSAFFSNPNLNIIKMILQRLYVGIFFSYCLVPFVVIQWDLATKVYSEVYFMGHILYFGWLLGYPTYKYFTKKLRRKEATYQNGTERNKHK